MRDRDARIVFYGSEKRAILLDFKGVLYDCDWDFIIKVADGDYPDLPAGAPGYLKSPRAFAEHLIKHAGASWVDEGKTVLRYQHAKGETGAVPLDEAPPRDPADTSLGSPPTTWEDVVQADFARLKADPAAYVEGHIRAGAKRWLDENMPNKKEANDER